MRKAIRQKFKLGILTIKSQNVEIGILFILFVIFICLFIYNNISRKGIILADSMNYLNIAYNIIHGNGAVQSTLGYNQPYLFNPKSTIPSPAVSQAPLYPYTIALLASMGISLVTSSLFISSISYCFIIIIIYFIMKIYYDMKTVYLSIIIILIYSPLKVISRSALSESVSIVIMLIAILLMMLQYHSFYRKKLLLIFLTGISVGLSISFRYALIPLLFVGLFCVYYECRHLNKIYSIALYLFGFSIPMIFMINRNMSVLGVPFPKPLSSNRYLLQNITDMFETSSNIFILLVSCIVMFFNYFKSLRSVIIFITKKHFYLLMLWAALYILFLVFQRTLYHFDTIDKRLTLPSDIIVLLIVAVIISVVFERLFNKKNVFILLIITVTISITQEIITCIESPIIKMEVPRVMTERLKWITKNTSPEDLIIGDNTIEIPFYYPKYHCISFSPYPYTIQLEYNTLSKYVLYHKKKYKNFYIILRNNITKSKSYLYYSFGPFIYDLIEGDISKYKNIYLIMKDAEIQVFKIVPY